MSKSELHAFIDRARSDAAFRKQLKELNPQEIINFAAKSGFDFSDEIKGRFINRWKGVYFCPQAIEVGRLCPGLIPEGFSNLIDYSQSTCSSANLKKRSLTLDQAINISSCWSHSISKSPKESSAMLRRG